MHARVGAELATAVLPLRAGGGRALIRAARRGRPRRGGVRAARRARDPLHRHRRPAGGAVRARRRRRAGAGRSSDGGRRVDLHRLDADCEVAQTRTADIDPFDAEDLALGPEGALWIADTGDNDRSRDTVAAIVLERGGDARLHRFTYPDGPHDAEALLVDGSGGR